MHIAFAIFGGYNENLKIKRNPAETKLNQNILSRNFEIIKEEIKTEPEKPMHALQSLYENGKRPNKGKRGRTRGTRGPQNSNTNTNNYQQRYDIQTNAKQTQTNSKKNKYKQIKPQCKDEEINQIRSNNYQQLIQPNSSSNNIIINHTLINPYSSNKSSPIQIQILSTSILQMIKIKILNQLLILANSLYKSLSTLFQQSSTFIPQMITSQILNYLLL